MPAAKKPASKTKTAAKSATKKATTVKRAPAKTHSTTSVKRVSKPALRSFRPTKSDEPFFTFRITHQTLYWIILAVIVVSLAAWVLSISIKVQGIYDQIDATMRTTESMTIVPKESN